MIQNQWLQKFNPSVSKYLLLALAGLMWSTVGLLLGSMAFTWLTQPVPDGAIILAGLGMVMALAANRFQFSSLARKNINRILAYPSKACLFAFQAWKGYAIIAVMMTGGMWLRNSLIPKPYLAVVYLAIGGALLLASFNYYARLATQFASKPTAEPAG
ncbi:MAG TPA: hypothetical protein PKW33_17625 [Anaerolineaceae bacterium]|nr:hypothetical protein [Anaerolineaceae bacterium]HPN53419.1 hypothetical protein [Anaerolineaceae bacterium]